MSTLPSVHSVLPIVLFTSTLGCGNLVVEISPTHQASRTDEFTLPVPPQQQFHIRTENGFIDCRVGEQESIQVTAAVTARARTADQAQQDLDVITIERAEIDGMVQLIAKVPDNINGAVDFTVTVPADLEIDADTTNGRITLAGLTRDATARTSNGAVTVTDCDGAVKVKTTNGKITLDGRRFKQVDATTTNGVVQLRGELAAGEHQLRTSNGSIRIETTGPPLRLTASTSNGRIRANGEKVRSGETVTLGETDPDDPGSASPAELTLRTSNGSIEVKHEANKGSGTNGTNGSGETLFPSSRAAQAAR